MIITPGHARGYADPEKQSPVDRAIETAFRALDLENLGISRSIDRICAERVEYAISPIVMSEEDIETIVRGALFINTRLRNGDLSRMDMFNNTVLELSVDGELSFADLRATTLGGEHLDKSAETLFNMAKLAVDSPYPDLYHNFSTS